MSLAASSESTCRGRNVSSTNAKLSAKCWFLTFPRCQSELGEVIQRAKDHFASDPKKGLQFLQFIRVAKELHEDGFPHLHLFLEFAKPLSTRKRDYFDFLTDKHGNYQTCRSAIGSLKYVSKKGEFEDYGALSGALAKQMSRKRGRGDDPAGEQDEKSGKKGKWALYAEQVVAGSTIEDLLEIDPGFVMMNRRKIDDFVGFMESIRHKVVNEKHPGVIKYTGEHLPTKQVVDWFNRNLLSGPREFKQKQLYIWGPGNMLKTTLITQLSTFFKTYWVPTLQNWYDEYSDNIDLAIIDEFEGQKTIPWMNLFLQGGTTTLEQKGKHVTKRKNIAVVILSNYSMEMNYYPKDVDTINLRVETVYVRTPFDLDNIHHITAEVPHPQVASIVDAVYDSDEDQDPSPSPDETQTSPVCWHSQVGSEAVDDIETPNQEDNLRLLRLASAGTARSKFTALYQESVVAKAIQSLEELDLRYDNKRLKGKEPEPEPDDDMLDITPERTDSEQEDEILYRKKRNKFIFEIDSD